MATKFTVTVDCADPDRLARFWAEALGYQLEEPPAGFGSWIQYWRSVGVPDDELDEGYDSVIDPAGVGPRLWFQKVPELKTNKNRLHLDLHVSGGRTVPIELRKTRVDAEAERLIRAGATVVRILSEEGLDHYAIALHDPEGNEFDLN